MTKSEKNPSKKSLKKTVAELIPIIDYDYRVEAYLMQDRTYMDILRVEAKDWNHLSKDDVNYEIGIWTRFYRIYTGDIKFITMRFRCNTIIQQEHLKYRKKLVKDDTIRKKLDYKIKELEELELNTYEREFYLMFFGKTDLEIEYYGAAEPPVRCGKSHLSGLTEPPVFYLA